MLANLHTGFKLKQNTMKYSILPIFIIFLFASCSNSNEKDWNGFVAQENMEVNIKGEKFKLKPLDTLILAENRYIQKAFQARKLADWLDENDVLRVGMEPDAPPTYFTKGDKETGFDYELLHIIFDKVFPGIEMEAKGFSYDTLHQLLLQPNPQIEIIAGGYVADTSLPQVAWTKPYLTFGYALIARDMDKLKYTNLLSLKGKKVGVYDDGIAELWLRKNVPDVGTIVKAVDNTDTPVSDWMKMLVTGEVDAIVYDYPFAVQEIGDYDDILTITNKRLNAPNDLMGYSFGIPAGNKKLLKKINDAIEQVKQSPDYGNLVAHFIPDPDLGKTAVASSDAGNENIKDRNMALASPKKEGSSDYEERKKAEVSEEEISKRKKREAKIEGYNGKVHRVEEGESLATIAQDLLGSPDRWEEIYLMNPHIASPDIIYAGTLLKIPAYQMVKSEDKHW